MDTTPPKVRSKDQRQEMYRERDARSLIMGETERWRRCGAPSYDQ